MKDHRGLELPEDSMEYEYYHVLPENTALFGPMTRKSIFFIIIFMFCITLFTILITMPITIPPFLLIVFSIYQYRKMSKKYYLKRIFPKNK